VSALSLFTAKTQAFEARVPDSFYGINAHELVLGTWTDPIGTESHLNAIEATGVDWVRADVTWAQVEPVLPVGPVHSYDWTFYDRWVERLAAHGMTWLPMPAGAPTWARSLSSTLVGCGARSAPDVTRVDDYRAFVRAVVARYGANGTFWSQRPDLAYRPVETVELWNEPNWAGFWCPEPSPETYAYFAAAGADGAHAADPEVTVSTGGLVTTREDILRNGRVYGMATDDYLQRMLAAVPALPEKLDAVALHLYDQDPDLNLSIIGWIRGQMEALGMGDQELLISEFGWHTQGGTDFVTEATRAANYESLVGQLSRTDCGITGISPHTWISPETDANDPEHWFGIANANATLKASASALAETIATYRGQGTEPAPRTTIELCRAPTPPDQDGDGVPDEDDDYPLDPTRWDGSSEQPPPDPDALPTPPRTPRAPRDFFGVYVRQMPWQADIRKAYYDSMQQARIGGVRDSVLWNHAEPLLPTDPAHVFSWGETDARVLGLAKRGIRVQPTFVSKPAWAGISQASVDASYAEFMAAYARQYGRGGRFWAENGNLDPGLAISDYEVWSNANLPEGAWDGTPTAAEYAATYAASRAALRAVDPEARAIVPVQSGGPAGTAPDFIRGMASARPALRGNIDGVYLQILQPAGAADVESLAAAVRTALADTGNATATLRIGVGWYTSGPGAISESTRAGLLSNTADRLARSNCGIDGFYADAWTMNEANPSNLWDWLGIADPATGALKPSGVAYAGVAERFLGWGSTEPDRTIVHSCGAGDPDRDGDGIPDPVDDFPLEPETSDTTAPQTQIDSGPSGTSSNPNPSFAFSASEAGSSFQCRLDSGAWSACSSPKAYSALADGNHLFEVRATDAAGNTDQTPAQRSFAIDAGAPQTQIDSGPSGTSSNPNPSFAFSASEAGSSFQCRLDSGTWSACSSPKAYSALADGNHLFEVRATDAAGNTDQTPAQRSFAIDRVAPEVTIQGPKIKGARATFELGAVDDHPVEPLECRVDKKRWTTCSNTHTVRSLREGRHLLRVRTSDAAGNTGSARKRWRMRG
jgi:hypothetical protein